MTKNKKRNANNVYQIIAPYRDATLDILTLAFIKKKHNI